MNKHEANWLRSSVQDILIPAFVELGFVTVPLDTRGSRSREIRRAFPFGRLRRFTSTGSEQIEVQFYKEGAPFFRINFGIVPLEGIEHLVGHVENKDVWIHYMNHYFAAYQIPKIRKWFGLFHWPGRTITEADYDALVSEVVSFLPEVEKALRSERRMWAAY